MLLFFFKLLLIVIIFISLFFDTTFFLKSFGGVSVLFSPCPGELVAAVLGVNIHLFISFVYRK